MADEKLWNKVFDVRYCPLHFWRSKHPEEPESPYNCNLEVYCCLGCPRRLKCHRRLCNFPAMHCDSKEANFSREELEEAFKKNSNSFSEFIQYLFNKRLEDAEERSQKGIQ